MGALAPLSSAANAGNYRYHDSGYGRGGYDRGEFDGRNSYRHRWHGHRHEGRNLAIGAFAAILGLAIAAEANRDHRYDRY
jgi:hypothetical protein